MIGQTHNHAWGMVAQHSTARSCLPARPSKAPPTRAPDAMKPGAMLLAVMPRPLNSRATVLVRAITPGRGAVHTLVSSLRVFTLC